MEKILKWPDTEGLIDDFQGEIDAIHADGDTVAVEMPAKAKLLFDPKALGADRVEYTGAELDGDLSTAELIHGKTVYLSEMVRAYGYEQTYVQYFDTILVCPTGDTCSLQELLDLAADYEAPLKQEDDGVLVVINEQTDLDEMNALIALFAEGAGGMAPEVESEEEFEGLSVLAE